MAFISNKQEQFRYFAAQLGEWDWSEKDVLDFGGNIGNILLDSKSTIDVARYCCMDVDREALDQGRRSFPAGEWVFYNRRSIFFNPEGITNLKIPELNRCFDIIVLYSVFTNIKRAEMLDLVEQLRVLLKKGGKLAFTFIDANHVSCPNEYNGNNLQWRLEKDNKDADIPGMLKKAQSAAWCTLVNNERLFLEHENIDLTAEQQRQPYFAYYTVKYMQDLFPMSEIFPPANNEQHHCCVIEAN